MKHASQQERKNCGENLAYFGGWNRIATNDDATLVSKSCDNWYDEIKDYSFASGKSTGGVIGHFTQV